MIDLRSDTVTKPTPAMRAAMANAKVGDDHYGEDPTVNELERRAAEAMGKEAALFTPSGTMGNAVALMTHGRPGGAVLLDKECHIYIYEQGGYAALAGMNPLLSDSPNGCPPTDFVLEYGGRTALRYPPAALVCVENTHNRRGGAVIPPDDLAELKRAAEHVHLPVHMDGARIFNAAAALNLHVRQLAQYADTVQFCFSKGLGAPVGSALAGSAEFIEQARRNRRLVGGAMRQAGVIAAAALAALEEMPKRLHEDHANARRLAERLQEIPELRLNPDDYPTNIVIVHTKRVGASAQEASDALKQRGILTSIYGPAMLRFVFHNDVSNENAAFAADAAYAYFEKLAAELR